MISPARVAAYQILASVSGGRADLPSAIAHARTSLKDDRDRALAAEIAAGVQRWRAALDHLIVHFSKRAMGRLDPEIVEILRLSAYQLLHLTRVPASAVVDDGVDLARRAGKRSAVGFVNAVLRAIARQRGRLPLPGRPTDPHDRDRALEYLTVTLSHPRWLAARWLDRLGLDRAERWMQFDNEPAALTLRTNTLKLTRDELIARLDDEDVRVVTTRFAPHGLVVREGHPLAGRGLDEGWFVVQDEASQLVALLAQPRAAADVRRALDACASPGGKTTAIAAAIGEAGLIVACDVRSRRMALLRRTVEACGADRVRLVQADLLRSMPFSQPFDCVLVDAPCSGLGTLRRDPDIRWRRGEDELPALATAELAMLKNAAAGVSPGGRLVYATCSSEPEENEQVAAAFLSAAPGFRPADLRAEAVLPPEVVDERGHLRTTPDAHGLEAFFGAAFVRGT